MKKIKLSDVCTINATNYSDDDSYDFVNYLDTGNITTNHIEHIQRIDISREKLPSRARRKVKFNSIIYSTVRPNQRHYGIIKSQPKNFLVSTGFAVIDAVPEKIDANFLYYQLSRDEVIENLQSIAEQSTTAYPSIKPSDLGNLEFRVPSLETQSRIGNFLCALDAKIALNKKINATLEAMAKTLYDYWFVQFNFPDENGKPYKTSGGKMIYSSELGRDIPDGWEVGTLADFVTISTETENPMNSPDKIYEHYSIPAYDDGKFPSMDKGSEINSGKYIVRSKNILYAKLNPTFKRIWQPFCLTGNAICSTEFLVFKLQREKNPAFVYATLNDCSFQEYMIKQASASTGSRKRVQPNNCLSYSINLPDVATISRFDKIYSPILKRMNSLIIENRRLAELRDWLLPMLMNGQAKFKET